MQRPTVIGHFAITADGKISTRNSTPALFTSPADKARLQEIRASADAVMVGRGTVVIDKMSMGISRQNLHAKRIKKGLPSIPLRVLVSNSGKLSSRWKVFQYEASPLIVFSTSQMPVRTRSILASRCDLYLFSEKKVNISAALSILREDYDVKTLVCEGGGTLFRSLLEANMVDELFLTIAPVIFGGKNAPTLTGKLGPFLSPLSNFSLIQCDIKDEECYLHLKMI